MDHNHITTDDLYMCKHCVASEDSYGMMIPACGLNYGLPCDDVLRYGDEGCKYEREEEQA